jgi:hypothetical protein
LRTVLDVLPEFGTSADTILVLVVRTGTLCHVEVGGNEMRNIESLAIGWTEFSLQYDVMKYGERVR